MILCDQEAAVQRRNQPYSMIPNKDQLEQLQNKTKSKKSSSFPSQRQKKHLAFLPTIFCDRIAVQRRNQPPYSMLPKMNMLRSDKKTVSKFKNQNKVGFIIVISVTTSKTTSYLRTTIFCNRRTVQRHNQPYSMLPIINMMRIHKESRSESLQIKKRHCHHRYGYIVKNDMLSGGCTYKVQQSVFAPPSSTITVIPCIC